MLIGIIGSKQSGKSTFVSAVSKHYRVIEGSFAEPLKRIVSILGFEHKYLYDQEFKEEVVPELGISAREMLQVLGTDIFRDKLLEFLPNFTLAKNGGIWVNLFKRKYEQIRKVDKNAVVIISDVRFLNEAETITEMGGVLIKIERPNIQKNNFSSHSSEKLSSQISTEYNIENNYSNLEEYQRECVCLFERIMTNKI